MAQIAHEAYVVPAGARETLYANMPLFGLGRALGVQQVGPGLNTAKQRLNG